MLLLDLDYLNYRAKTKSLQLLVIEHKQSNCGPKMGDHALCIQKVNTKLKSLFRLPIFNRLFNRVIGISPQQRKKA